ncbi:MAG TPA: lysylphosphatidylglycerol synthase domain-containing protein [Gemmatimonadales bacterium]|nr:lysylphosphatidylglycerol synthase domain-containing protein [Gemmatimonadales bacterium]
MSVWTVHLICLALLAVDLGARALRMRILAGALGHRVGLGDAFAANALGDAACALTPMRLGGEPARLAGLLRAGVPATATFVAIAFEAITMWPVIAATIVFIAYHHAPGWLETAAPRLLDGLGRAWTWLALAVGVSLALYLVVRRRVRVMPRITRRPWRRVRVYLRRLPASTLVAAGALGFVNLATRTAILPVLMLLLPEPPPLGPAILGSFALLYGQLALPTPSGAGVVDLGFLAGVAGNTGAQGLSLLFWWRFYTSLLGVLLGAWAAVRLFGWAALKTMMMKGKGREAAT